MLDFFPSLYTVADSKRVWGAEVWDSSGGELHHNSFSLL